MKAAIIICKEVSKICSSAGCFRAFNNRSGYFGQYDEELILCAYTDCLGCEEMESEYNSGFLKRLSDLKKAGAEKIHLGICTSEKYCKYSEKLIGMVKDFGFDVQMGTHE